MKNLIKMDDLGCFSIFFGSKMDGEHNEKPYYIKWDDLGGKLPYFLWETTPGPHLANGPWKKSLNFIFPTKYVIPKSLKG